MDGRRQYNRHYRRTERGKSYLNDLEQEAVRRKVSTQELVRQLLETIAKNKLVDEILDRG